MCQVIHYQDVRDALVAEVRVNQDWGSRQADFGSPDWKLQQIDAQLRMALTALELFDAASADDYCPDETEQYDQDTELALLDLEDEMDVESLVDAECALAENHSGSWDC